MVEKHTCKYIFFKTLEEAIRFKELYGGLISTHNDFSRYYFGKKTAGMEVVLYWATTKEMEEISKVLGMKRKKWNGHLCYMFE